MVGRGWVFFVWIALASIALGCASEENVWDKENPWKHAEKIVEQIVLPEIPQNTFVLSDFGGKGDGVTDNKAAFDNILLAVTKSGGGKIVVEPGDYLIKGPIHLSSHTNLHLEEGSRLVFGNKPEYFLPVVLTSWEGTRAYNYSPFIYAFEASHVAITGKGEIDGNASTTWNKWKQLQDPDKEIIRAMNNKGVPLAERIFGEGHYLRPHLIQFYECANILVEDVKISDSPFWCLHFVFSHDITVRRVCYEAFNYNNDGIDPESSENVLIEDVVFNNRDDNIAIKAGRDLEARTLKRPSRNIVVRNCKFRGHNAIAVGSEMSGGVSDVYVEDCTYAGKVIYGFYLKGNRDRGGTVNDIYARNIQFDSTQSTLIIDSNYKNQGFCCPPVFKNIYVENVSARHASDHGIYLKGSPQIHLDSVFIKDVEILSASQGMEVSYMDHLEMEDVWINGQNYASSGRWPEWIKGKSQETGREVWQITSDTAPAVACYFEGQAFTSDEKYVVYASRKSGEWKLYRTNLQTGEATPITPSSRMIKEDEYTLMPDGERVCYMDGWKLYATHVENMEEETLFDFSGKLPLPPIFSGSFTNDGRYTLVYIRGDRQDWDRTVIYRVDLQEGEILAVKDQPAGKITHPLINPEDPEVISYVPGPDTQNDMTLPMEQRARTWKVDLRAGTDNQFLTMPYGFRATHESWSFDGERFFFFRKTRPGWSPVAICSQDKNGNDFQVHYESDSIKLGHGVPSRDGQWFISDCQQPGENELVLVNLQNGEARVLCFPNSSVDGGHSNRAHVHPSFSPNGNYVCFTSDRTGVSQVYVVPVQDLTQSSNP